MTISPRKTTSQAKMLCANDEIANYQEQNLMSKHCLFNVSH